MIRNYAVVAVMAILFCGACKKEKAEEVEPEIPCASFDQTNTSYTSFNINDFVAGQVHQEIIDTTDGEIEGYYFDLNGDCENDLFLKCKYKRDNGFGPDPIVQDWRTLTTIPLNTETSVLTVNVNDSVFNGYHESTAEENIDHYYVYEKTSYSNENTVDLETVDSNPYAKDVNPNVSIGTGDNWSNQELEVFYNYTKQYNYCDSSSGGHLHWSIYQDDLIKGDYSMDEYPTDKYKKGYIGIKHTSAKGTKFGYIHYGVSFTNFIYYDNLQLKVYSWGIQK